MSAPSDLLPRLIRHEGLRLRPYRDTAGKLTIGVGRNLTDVGISTAEAMTLLANDVVAARNALDKEWPWWKALDQVRADALVELIFNMGAGAPPVQAVPDRFGGRSLQRRRLRSSRLPLGQTGRRPRR